MKKDFVIFGQKTEILTKVYVLHATGLCYGHQAVKFSARHQKMFLLEGLCSPVQTRCGFSP
jgi:hypothetical protein